MTAPDRIEIGSGFEAKVEQISPEVASDILERGYDLENRPVRRSTIKSYARDMAQGAWKLTGDSIKLDRQGRLRDGQHRLWAVIESGVTIETLVIRGVPDDAFQFMDIGAKRTISDLLAMEGYRSTGKLGAAAGFYWTYLERGKFERPTAWERPRHDQLVVLVNEHHGLADWVQRTSVGRLRALGISASHLASMCYVFAEKEEELAHDFLHFLETGAGMEEGHPALMLRELLLRRAAHGETRTEYEYLSAVTIKAWNALRDGRAILHLRYSASENYPAVA